MSRKAMQVALEALEEINKLSIGENAICLPAEIDGAMDALRERLAQPEQESVKFCTAPPKKEWVGLTDEEMEALFLNEDGVRFARYIESRLKDKNA